MKEAQLMQILLDHMEEYDCNMEEAINFYLRKFEDCGDIQNHYLLSAMMEDLL